MLKKVMLVDDEPFILQGLSVIINWEEMGYEIVKMASDGEDALNYIMNNEVDLLITDIRMPGMSGIDLLTKIRTDNISDCYIIILSGYNDFKYAQAAIRYSCTDYLLKPIQKDQLLENLNQISAHSATLQQADTDGKIIQRGYLMQNLSAMLQGRADDKMIQFVRENIKCNDRLYYIHISLADFQALEEMSDDEIEAMRNKIYDAALLYTNAPDNLFRDFFMVEEEYEVGFIYCESMAAEKNTDTAGYINGLYRAVSSAADTMPVVLLAGKAVDGISRISLSYSSACRLRSFRGFTDGDGIYYYDDIKVEEEQAVLYSEELDALVAAIVDNNTDEILSCVDRLYSRSNAGTFSKNIKNLNTNYLMFRLLDLATKQDESVNQSEVLTYISGKIFTEGTGSDARSQLKAFSLEYAEYLIQLRKNLSGGILTDIENEIKQHYAEPLSLKELGQKYYINSSYLGQIFRKRYGQSFKNYLNSYRVSEAANMLLKTDKKIVDIANDVGYHDFDYFISRFIEVYDCTPARYRKSQREQ